MAKVARVQISKEWLEIFLRGDFGTRPNQTISTNAPMDLEIVGLAYPSNYYGYLHTLDIYVKSESFEDIPEGVDPPQIDPFKYSLVTNG